MTESKFSFDLTNPEYQNIQKTYFLSGRRQNRHSPGGQEEHTVTLSTSFNDHVVRQVQLEL